MDPRAYKILADAYWSAKGWNVPRKEPSPPDFAYAKAMGMIFDKETFTHDSAIDRIVAARSVVDVRSAATAFVASLTSRKVYLRPALGSYFAIENVAPHRFVANPDNPLCTTCRQFKQWDDDFSSINFARLKWGLLPRFPVNLAFVLERFAAEPAPVPNGDDWAVLGRLLKIAAGLGDDARARNLERFWKPVIRSSRAERDSLIEILVAAGVLVPSRTTATDVGRIPIRSNWSDGAALWRGDDGVNIARSSQLFGWGSVL